MFFVFDISRDDFEVFFFETPCIIDNDKMTKILYGIKISLIMQRQ